MVEILWRTSDFVVCVKPAGVVSQDAGESSLPGLLRAQLHTEYMGVIHRLDREVGGVMVYALTPKAAAALSRSVQERTMEKTYLAVLRGVPPEAAGKLEDLLYHDKARNKTFVVDRKRKGVRDACLEYVLLETAGNRALVQVRLKTGRTHQIRVQFASRGTPLVGDGKYGGKEPGVPLGLWSCRLAFPAPATGEPMEFFRLPPDTAPWDQFQIITERRDWINDLHQ